jgi:hypothetical protein
MLDAFKSKLGLSFYSEKLYYIPFGMLHKCKPSSTQLETDYKSGITLHSYFEIQISAEKILSFNVSAI